MDITYLYDINSFHIYYVEEIESTNTYLKEHYHEFPKPSVLIAKRQTKGRGRYDRVWKSDNDLIFSLLFDNLYYNEIIAPLSISLVLESKNVKAGIKWPNDIYINSNKLSGVLIENIYSDKLLASIVGIGINRTSKEDYSSVGLLDFLGDFSNMEFIKEVLIKYQELLNYEFSELISLYKKYSIVIGKKIVYKNNIYTATSIDEFGHLVISDDVNEYHITSDEISIKESIIE